MAQVKVPSDVSIAVFASRPRLKNATSTGSSGAPAGRPSLSSTVNSTRFGPQTSWPGAAMSSGVSSGAAAGGPQPSISPSTDGAAAQAAPDPPAADGAALGFGPALWFGP